MTTFVIIQYTIHILCIVILGQHTLVLDDCCQCIKPARIGCILHLAINLFSGWGMDASFGFPLHFHVLHHTKLEYTVIIKTVL